MLDISLSILSNRWKNCNKEVDDQSKAAELEENGREVCGFEILEAASPKAQAQLHSECVEVSLSSLSVMCG